MAEHLLCELSVPGRVGFRFPDSDVPATPLPEDLTRDDLPLPELAEVDVVRYFTRLSQLNYGVDTGFYPLVTPLPWDGMDPTHPWRMRFPIVGY